MDLAIILAILGGVVWFGYRLKTGLAYKWDWGVIPQYLLRFDAQTGAWTTGLITQGLLATLRLSIWATILGTLGGTLVGLSRVSQSLFQRLMGLTFVELIRNLPPLVLIFIFYFFVSDQLMPLLGVEEAVRAGSPATLRLLEILFGPADLIPAFLSAIITLAFYEAAYIAEIVRAGVQSIETGQWEASAALGFSRFQQFRHVILPQAIRRILPPLAGQFISTIKDSAIVSVISIQELTFQGLALMAATYLTFEVWITVLGLYLILTLACSLAVSRIEVLMTRHLP